MDLLAKLEQALEGMVEGVFTRAFKAPLQPVEVAKRLTREMENHRTASVNATYVPNEYVVSLSQESYQGFQAISGQLLGELEQYLRDFIAEHAYQTVGPIAVRLVEDQDLKGNDLDIAWSSDAHAVPSVMPAPSVLRSDPPANVTHRSAAQTTSAPHVVSALASGLEVTAGEATGQHFPLADGITIGRGPTNAIALTEPGVSRSHAEIVWQEGAWVLRDLESTNGTFVNDRRITTHILHPGDLVRIGQTNILVR